MDQINVKTSGLSVGAQRFGAQRTERGYGCSACLRYVVKNRAPVLSSPFLLAGPVQRYAAAKPVFAVKLAQRAGHADQFKYLINYSVHFRNIAHRTGCLHANRQIELTDFFLIVF